MITTLTINKDTKIKLNTADLNLLEHYRITMSSVNGKPLIWAIKEGEKVRLSRLLTKPREDQIVKFKNGDRYDFTRENLEVLTHKENGHKYGANRHGKTSKYHGVYYFNTTKRWVVSLITEGNSHKEHYYQKEDDAAIAADHLMRTLSIDKTNFNFLNLSDHEIESKYNQIRSIYGKTRKEIKSIAQQGSKAKNTASKYVGVCFDKRRSTNPWNAKIKYQGKQFYLGSYENEKDAALAYNKKALKLYGSCAKVNDVTKV
jgi:hypothetical protein